MRLTENEVNTIVSLSRTKFGEDVKVILFGSRTDDLKRGGDIDLLIIPSMVADSDKLCSLQVQFLASLKLAIGDQKIDLLVKTASKSTDSFYQQAEKTGIPLC